jgi:hypothetical protein
VSSFSSLPSLSLVSSRHEGSWGLIHFCQRISASPPLILRPHPHLARRRAAWCSSRLLPSSLAIAKRSALTAWLQREHPQAFLLPLQLSTSTAGAADPSGLGLLPWWLAGKQFLPGLRGLCQRLYYFPFPSISFASSSTCRSQFRPQLKF